jgi:hypothetical protein
VSAISRAVVEQPKADAGELTQAPRVPAAQVPSIKGLRLSPHGADAKLVNISTSGLLAECASRLKVGSTVAVLFEGTFTESTVVGRIARCEVSTMGKDGVLRYFVGIDFNKPIDLGLEAVPAAASQPQPIVATSEPPRPRPVAVPPPAPAIARNRW